MSRRGSRPNLAGMRGAGDLDGQLGGGVGVLAREQEEVRQPCGDAVGVPALMRWALVTTPDWAAWRNTCVSRTRGIASAASRSRRTSPGADGRQLVDVADEQQVGPGGDGFDEFVGQDQVEHRGLVDDEEVDVEGMVPVEGGVAAGAQRQEPVDGRGGLPGEFGEPFRGPPGRRDQLHLGVLGPGQGHDRGDGEALAAAGAAGQDRDLRGQREPDRVLLGRCQVGAGAGAQPGEGPVPVDGAEVRHPVGMPAEQQLRSDPARDVSARWNGTRIHRGHRPGPGRELLNDNAVLDGPGRPGTARPARPGRRGSWRRR